MPQIDWFGPGDPRMDGAKSVEHAVAYTRPVASALMRYSSVLRRDAQAILDMAYHRPEVERSYIDVIHEGQGEFEWMPWLDSTVYLAAPDDRPEEKGKRKREGWRGNTYAFAAPASIELGHYTKGRQHEGEGPRTKSDHVRHWVPGVAPLQKAAKRMVANRRLSI